MLDPENRPVRRALISVSDKTGIVEFAKSLHDKGVDILSTGGTAKLLIENFIPVTEVSKHTGFPEIMDGRVKTLHPKIHGGILGRRGQDDGVMKDNDIAPIDLVVVNLYPFERLPYPVSNEEIDKILQHIDIGGATMIRSAAKNFQYVLVVTSPEDYSEIIGEMKANDAHVSYKTRKSFALKAFNLTREYDRAIAEFISGS